MTDAALILPDGREVGLRGDSFVGRDQVNQIQIENTTVSRRHALLVERDDKWWIADSGSFNGTFLNDETHKIEGRRLLKPGDQVRVCEVSLTFHSDQAAPVSGTLTNMVDGAGLGTQLIDDEGQPTSTIMSISASASFCSVSVSVNSMFG